MAFPSNFERIFYIDDAPLGYFPNWAIVSTNGGGRQEDFWWCKVNTLIVTVSGKQYKFDHWGYSGVVPDWMGSDTSTYRRSQVQGTDPYSGKMIVYIYYVSYNPPGPVVTSYKVTTAALPTQGGLTTGSGTYTAGAPVTITATPNTGYRFICWKLSTGETSTQKNYQFSMPSENVTAVAFFVKCTNKILRLK